MGGSRPERKLKRGANMHMSAQIRIHICRKNSPLRRIEQILKLAPTLLSSRDDPVFKFFFNKTHFENPDNLNKAQTKVKKYQYSQRPKSERSVFGQRRNPNDRAFELFRMSEIRTSEIRTTILFGFRRS